MYKDMKHIFSTTIRVLFIIIVVLIITPVNSSNNSEKKIVHEEGRVSFDYCSSLEPRKVNVKLLTILPVPLEIGVNGKLHLEISSKNNKNNNILKNITTLCKEYIIRLTFIKKGLTYENGFLPLCDLINQDPDKQNVLTLDTDILLEKQLDVGIYTTKLKIQNTTSNDNFLNLCLVFEEIITTGWSDYASAIVAFAIAAAASWQLGQWVTIFDLPLITGYLIVGVICGPYVCDLLTEYKIYLIGPQLNNLSLSFIAFAAGEEIYFPALKGLFRGILFQIGGVTISTLLFIVIIFLFTHNSLASSWTHDMSEGCFFSVSFLLGIIMVARSPATIVALLQELDVTLIPTQKMKLIVGVTIVSDIVVLVGFGIISAAVSSACPVAGVNGFDETLNVESILLLLLQFVAIGIVGGISGFFIYSILALPFKRFNFQSIVIYRSYMKGSLIIPFGVFIFVILDKFKTFTLEYFGKQFSIEPLLVCMVASSIAAHRSEWREQFGNILEKFAPYILLPFFTLTGASLQLSEVITILPLALTICTTRIVSIYFGSKLASQLYKYCNKRKKAVEHKAGRSISLHKTIDTKFLWLTYLSQAGIALGLSLEIKDRFKATFGGSFETLILSVVILNQVVGPPLAKYGMQLMMKENKKNIIDKRNHSNASSTLSDIVGGITNIDESPLLKHADTIVEKPEVNIRKSILEKKFSYTLSPLKNTSDDQSTVNSTNSNNNNNKERTFSNDSLFSFESDQDSTIRNNTPLISSPSSAYFGLKRRRVPSVTSPLVGRSTSLEKILSSGGMVDINTGIVVDNIVEDVVVEK